jgi:hypothetical protein
VTAGWQEVGDGVFVRRHAELDLNCGLVVGDGACLVVDTGHTWARQPRAGWTTVRIRRRP